MKTHLFLLIATTLFFGLPSNAQISTVWMHTYGGTKNEEAYSVNNANDGGYILAGYSKSDNGQVGFNNGMEDVWIVKLTADGNIQWTKVLGSSWDDIAHCIIPTEDNGFIMAGKAGASDGDVTGNHGGYDCWIVKLDADGEVLWKTCLGGSNIDEAYAIKQTTDKGYIVAARSISDDGQVSYNHGGYDFWLIKIDGSGNIQWEKSYGGSNDDVALGIDQTSDGGYIATGYTKSNDGDVSGLNGGEDYWTIKVDSIGNLKWQSCLGGSDNEEANGVLQLPDNNIVVAGYTFSNDGDVTGNHGSRDSWIIVYDNNGNVLKSTCYGGSEQDAIYGITKTTSGGFAAAGIANTGSGGNMWMAKFDKNAFIKWQKTYNGYRAYSIKEIADDSFVLAGSENTVYYFDFKVLRTCKTGYVSIAIEDRDYCFSTELNARGNFIHYRWNTGDTTKRITITEGGTYSVSAYNDDGCPATDSYDAPGPIPLIDHPEICMVTFDESSGKNKIIYHIENNEFTDSVIFYRLNNQNGLYYQLDTYPVTDTSVFIDSTANPAQKSFQYVVTLKDTCGRESLYSPMHRTIYLHGGVFDNLIKLDWTEYKGFSFSNYNVYRSLNNDDYELIATLPKTTRSFTDVNPPDVKKKYQVRVTKETPCVLEDTTFNESASNILVYDASVINDINTTSTTLYPNPFNRQLLLSRKQTAELITVELVDIYGKIISRYYLQSGIPDLTIPATDLPSGIYLVRINNRLNIKVIKQ